MGINVGAFFAPFAAMGIRNWWLKMNGFLHDGSLPAMCHQYIDGTLQDVNALQELSNSVSLNGAVGDLGAFANTYIETFSRGYNFAFGLAAIAMVISLMAYLIFTNICQEERRLPVRRQFLLLKSLWLFLWHLLPVQSLLY